MCFQQEGLKIIPEHGYIGSISHEEWFDVSISRKKLGFRDKAAVPW